MTTYTLRTPVTHNGTTYSELTFRPPVTGDLMLLDNFKGETSKMVALMSAIADVPIQAFKQVSLADFTALSGLVAPLLGEQLPEADGSTE